MSKQQINEQLYDDEANLDLIDDERDENYYDDDLDDQSPENESDPQFGRIKAKAITDSYDSYDMLMSQGLDEDGQEAYKEAIESQSEVIAPFAYSEEVIEKTAEEIAEEEHLNRYGLVANKNGHYVDKAEFYRHMCMYCEERDKALAEGREKPRPDDYIGLCITKIAQHIAQRPNFCGYTYKEEFIGDSIEACIKYIDNFNPKKSNNPFCYFTTVCMYCFLGRIKQEKKQSIIKGALMMQSAPGEFMTTESDDNFNIDGSVINNHTFVELAYEQKRKDEANAEAKRIAREQRKKDKQLLNKNSLDFLF